jgi:hypothetical protein
MYDKGKWRGALGRECGAGGVEVRYYLKCEITGI